MIAKNISLLLKSGNQKSGKALKMSPDMVKTLVFQLLILSKLERRSLCCQMIGPSIQLLREYLKLAASRSLTANQLIGEQQKLLHSHHLSMMVSMCACLVKMLSAEPSHTDTQLFSIKSKTNLTSLSTQSIQMPTSKDSKFATLTFLNTQYLVMSMVMLRHTLTL